MIAEFDKTRGLVYEYHRGDISPTQAVKKLAKIGLEGQYMAAEIQLQEAVGHEIGDGSLYDAARDALYEVKDTEQIGYSQSAWLRLAQFPAYQALFGKEVFLSPDAAWMVHNNTYEATRSLVNNLNQTRRQRMDQRFHNRCSGLLAEASTLLLLQRFAINSEVTNCWQPVQSLLQQDLGNHGTNRRYFKNGRDIEIFTDNEGRPVRSYNLQVKNKCNRLDELYEADIAVISVDTDLEIDDRYSVKRAIFDELRRLRNADAGDCRRAGVVARLDARTEKLLTLIEQ